MEHKPHMVRKTSALYRQIIDPDSSVYLTPAGEIVTENGELCDTNPNDLIPTHFGALEFMEQVILSACSLKITDSCSSAIRDQIIQEYNENNIDTAYSLASVLWEL